MNFDVKQAAQAKAMKELFLGEHLFNVDSQRRVAIPSQWRSGEAAENLFFLFPGRDKSLQLVPAATFQELLGKLRKISFADGRAAIALASIGSMAQECACDRQGRITLTKKLMEHAEITERVLLLGAVTTIQAWKPENWQNRQVDSETGLDVLQALQERPDDFSEIIRHTLKS